MKGTAGKQEEDEGKKEGEEEDAEERETQRVNEGQTGRDVQREKDRPRRR